MHKCDSTVTVVRRVNGAYVCSTVSGVRVIGKKAIDTGSSGDTPASGYTVRFPRLGDADMPSPGDYIAFGAVSSVSGISELEPYGYFRVASVSDMRRGFHPVAHVAVRGE